MDFYDPEACAVYTNDLGPSSYDPLAKPDDASASTVAEASDRRLAARLYSLARRCYFWWS